MFASRRDFLFAAVSTATVGLVWGAQRRAARAQEAPSETTTVRLAKGPSICNMPQYVVDELLADEGIMQVERVVTDAGPLLSDAIASGRIDFAMHFSGPMIVELDRGKKITMLAGVHVGCFELFAKDGINSIADLKGRSVGISALESSPHVFVSAMAALVGLDPSKDINWVTSAQPKPIELFLDGKVDAFLGFPPEPQRLRAQNVGNVIVNSAQDRPWSQYFCCMLAGNRDYIRRNPVATKRVLRAIIKAAELCAAQPEQVAQRIVDAGFTPRYDYALQTLKEIAYARWREYDPEDAIRFYSLRLRESGLIKATPNKILADGTDWRFLKELKRELKG
jgi:NitT/TauT family transport system substrate-binding protein